MKIVHLCLSCFYIDNYSYQENMLPKYHVLQGHDVTVIASLVSFDKQGKPCLLPGEAVHLSKDNFKVIRVDYKKPFYIFNKFIRIYNKTYQNLELEKPDIIFIHDFSFMDIIQVIKYVQKNKKVRIYVDCHTDYINSAQTWLSKNIFHHVIWRYYAAKLSPYVSKFYGVTPLRSEFLKKAYKIDDRKIELLVMGVDDDMLNKKNRKNIKDKFFADLGLTEENFIIVTGGKIDNKKNIHLVMEAVHRLKNKNVRLIVFGTVAAEMQTFFDSLLENEQIIYVGWLNSAEILDYFILANLVVFPGTHSVLWEQAVGIGTPCVFKYWEGMTHVDVGGNCRFLYQDSVEEVYRVLSDIIDTPKSYMAMKLAAETQGPKQFAYSEIARTAIDE